MESDKEAIATVEKEEDAVKDTNGEKNGDANVSDSQEPASASEPAADTTTTAIVAPVASQKLSLGEISAIDGEIAKAKTEHLQVLHNLFYGKNGFGPQIKRNIRKFAGFDDTEDPKKLEHLLTYDIAALRQTAAILDLELKEENDTKDSLANAIIEFLKAPTGKTFEEERDNMDDGEEAFDEPEDDDGEEEVEEKPKAKKRGGQSSTTGRPKRATATARVWTKDFLDSEEEELEEERPKVGRKKGRGGDSDSGSDYNPSGGGSDSEGDRRKSARQAAPPTRVSQRGRGRRRDSESEEEESEDESDDFSEEEVVPAKKKVAPAPNRSTPRRGAAQHARKRKQESESEEDAQSEDEEDEEPESDDSEKQKKRKPATKSTPQKNSKGRPKRAAVAPAKKKRKESSGEDDDDDGAADESENEPLKKPKKGAGTGSQPPSDDDIKTLLKDILAEANLEEITMKTVCKKVYAYYPNHDLSQRKDFIKQTVKSLIAA